MSIFGSRDDDPLLQDDPFAPNPKNDPSEEGPPGEKSAGEDTTDEGLRAGDSAMPERPDADSARRGSVFGPADETRGRSSVEEASGSDEDGTRVLVRLLEEAAEGRLDRLNTAVDAGWRLRRIELLDDASDKQGQSADASRSLAFVLHKPNS